MKINHARNYTISLHGMHFFASHGVSRQEKKVGNHFRVDLEVSADLSKASASDDLSLTVNYGELFDIVKNEVSIPSDLIENVAERIFRSVKERFPDISFVKVCVSKINPPLKGEMEEASITISG